jgi:hypothetical protein
MEQPLVEIVMKCSGAKLVLTLVLLAIALPGCSSRILPADTPTAAVSIVGVLRPWASGTPIAARQLALCRSLGDPREGLCELLPNTAMTDRQGRFQFYGVPAGTYFLLYDSGLSDFDEAMIDWAGKTLHFGDREWLSGFLGVDLTEGDIEYRMPEGISLSPDVNWLSTYCLLTLLVGKSPFVIAHDLESASHDRELHCAVIEVLPEQTAHVDVQALYFGE